MIQVCSSQFNHRYNNRIHFPYSIAMLISFFLTNKKINQFFEFEKVFVFREKIEEYIKQCEKSDILLCSCYVWNWEITLYLAKNVKKLNPNCTIIFGGPHVPSYDKKFFEKYPFVDIIVHGEGEYILSNIFEQFLKDKDYSKIKGIETKEYCNPPEDRIKNIEEIPSPYLSNLIWDLVDSNEDVQWIASWETNRGCPYQCTFCDWGSATNTPMRKFSEERLMKEVEWFANNHIPYIDCCDANFGIYLERDLRLAKKLKEVTNRKKFPETFRPNWAKFSSEKIIPIAKELQDVGLLRAVTLSVQSLDELTLDTIKRENIKFEKFSDLTESFEASGIPTYSEIIMGLPGETLESFKRGLAIIATDTRIGSIQIYNCSILPNAPMNEPNYIKRFKIETLHSPVDTVHAQISNKGIEEFEDIAIGTSSYTFEELEEMYQFSWAIQTFHVFGITELLWKYFKKTHNLEFIKFYDTLLEFCKKHKSSFSKEFQKMKDHMINGYSGKGWNHYDPKIGDIYWPIEEASWLRLVFNKTELLESVQKFLRYIEEKFEFNDSESLIEDLAKFQVFLLTIRSETQELRVENFEYNWKEFFMSKNKLERMKNRYFYKNLVNEKESYKWSYKAIWFGRFKKRFKITPEKLQVKNLELTSKIVK